MPEGWRSKAGLLSRALIDTGRGTAFSLDSLECRLTNTLRKYVKMNSSTRIETCLAAHCVVDKAFTESFHHRGGEVVGPAAPAQRLASALALEKNSEAFFRTIRNAVPVDASGARR